MTITSLPGPLVVFQDGGVLENSSANQNPDQGPSLFAQATGLLDPRAAYTFYPGMANGPVGFTSAGVAISAAPAVGWLNATMIVSDYAPSAVATANIAALQNTVADTALTLVSVTGAGITVDDSILNAATGAAVTSLLRIDNTPGFVTFGGGAVAVWDPANPPVGRAVSLTSAGNMSGANITVVGYDAYGYYQSETRAGPNANTVNTAKTFKWIASVTSDTTDAVNTISVGTADIFGLPLRCDVAGNVCAFFNDTWLTSATFTAADTTSPATVSTGDVRGTITQGTTDGTKRLHLMVTVSPNNISSLTGLFGVTPA
jgi:hypothetical protein